LNCLGVSLVDGASRGSRSELSPSYRRRKLAGAGHDYHIDYVLNVEQRVTALLAGCAAGGLFSWVSLSYANGYRERRFEWADEISRTMTLPWCRTGKLGHQGQHIAGTGECDAAVRDS
jgi:hypothetical protein